MKTKFFVFNFVIIIFFLLSCKNNDIQNSDTLNISGITNFSVEGEKTGPNVDERDWKLNYKFTDKEKQLFDTLNFDKTAVDIVDTSSAIYRVSNICFAPNPYNEYSRFMIYKDFHVLNLVLVNNKYQKIIKERVIDAQSKPLDLTNLQAGLYRLYYVIQNDDYNIVYSGYGDIEKK